MTTPVDHFRSLHQPGRPLVLPNVWDTGSARLVANSGATAIATTSAGVAWAHGLPDGGDLTPVKHIQLAEQLVAAIDLPVTLDIEDGYSHDPEEVTGFLSTLARVGIVGVNLEDSTNGTQRPKENFAAFLAAVRTGLGGVGIDMFINARVDTYLLGEPDTLASIIDRTLAYIDAGADGIFLPGLADLTAIATVCHAVPAPVNIMVPAADLTINDLARAGVARVSTGMWIAELAYGATQSVAAATLAGDLATPALQPVDYAALNQQMTRSRAC